MPPNVGAFAVTVWPTFVVVQYDGPPGHNNVGAVRSVGAVAADAGCAGRRISPAMVSASTSAAQWTFDQVARGVSSSTGLTNLTRMRPSVSSSVRT